MNLATVLRTVLDVAWLFTLDHFFAGTDHHFYLVLKTQAAVLSSLPVNV